MDTTQHNRGWDLSVEKGIISVDLVNEAPKEQMPPRAAGKKGVPNEGDIRYPTPTDLTAKDLAPNKPRQEGAAKRQRREEGRQDKPAPKTAGDTTPLVAIKVSTVDPLPLDGRWVHCVLYL